MKLLKQFNLYEIKGQGFCDSLQVAENFEKEHKHILQVIEGTSRKDTQGESKHINGLIDELNQSDVITSDYFIKSKYKDSQNKTQPKYLLTRDGFTLLAMGFTGAKALKFKLDYINRFNQMEQFITALAATRAEFPEFTKAIKSIYKNPHKFSFTKEINLIYKIVIGKTAKEYRESYNLPSDEVIKPYLTLEQIKAVESLQRVDIGLMTAGLSFRQRKDKLSELYEYEKACI